jgi:serine/threonine protein phosphatase PrpC
LYVVQVKPFHYGPSPDHVLFYLKYAHWTQRGYYPDDPHKENQDVVGVHENFSGSPTHAFMAVFDGHGPAGGDCSRYVAKKLPTLLSDKIADVRRRKVARSSHGEPTTTGGNNRENVSESHPVLTPDECQSCIHQAFVETNQAMHRSIMVEDQLSGTTAIGVLFHDNHMTIANCGDSRAILGRKRELSDAPINLSLVDATNGTRQITQEEKPGQIPPDSAAESSTRIQEDSPGLEPPVPTAVSSATIQDEIPGQDPPDAATASETIFEEEKTSQDPSDSAAESSATIPEENPGQDPHLAAAQRSSVQVEKPSQDPSEPADESVTELELFVDDDEPPRIEPVKPVVLEDVAEHVKPVAVQEVAESVKPVILDEVAGAIGETGSQDHPFDELKPRIASPEPPPESPPQLSPYSAADKDPPVPIVDVQDGPFDEAPLQTEFPHECPKLIESRNEIGKDGTETVATAETLIDVVEAVETGSEAASADVTSHDGGGAAAAESDPELTSATTAAPSFMALPLSRDQTPWRKDERERVKAAGACVWSIDQVEGREPFHDDWGDAFEGDKAVDYTIDPPRLWIPGKEYPGTAFTRSIGDWLAESIGVIADPEMMTMQLTGNDQIVVIASDGVFEFMTNQEVIDLCAQCSTPIEACEIVARAAYEQWLVYENRTDDISVIVCFLRCSRPPVEGEKGTSDELADSLNRSDLNMSGSSAQKMRYSRGISIVQSSNGVSPASIADALSQLSRDAPHDLIDEEEGSC